MMIAPAPNGRNRQWEYTDQGDSKEHRCSARSKRYKPRDPSTSICESQAPASTPSSPGLATCSEPVAGSALGHPQRQSHPTHDHEALFRQHQPSRLLGCGKGSHQGRASVDEGRSPLPLRAPARRHASRLETQRSKRLHPTRVPSFSARNRVALNVRRSSTGGTSAVPAWRAGPRLDLCR